MRIYQNILILLLLLILGMLSYLSVLPEYDWFGWSVVIVIVCLGLVLPKSGSFFDWLLYWFLPLLG